MENVFKKYWKRLTQAGDDKPLIAGRYFLPIGSTFLAQLSDKLRITRVSTTDPKLSKYDADGLQSELQRTESRQLGYILYARLVLIVQLITIAGVAISFIVNLAWGEFISLFAVGFIYILTMVISYYNGEIGLLATEIASLQMTQGETGVISHHALQINERHAKKELHISTHGADPAYIRMRGVQISLTIAFNAILFGMSVILLVNHLIGSRWDSTTKWTVLSLYSIVFIMAVIALLLQLRAVIVKHTRQEDIPILCFLTGDTKHVAIGYVYESILCGNGYYGETFEIPTATFIPVQIYNPDHLRVISFQARDIPWRIADK